MTGTHRVPVRDGLVLRAEVRGEGPSVLLIHGFTGSVEAWGDRILLGLAATHRVIAVDLPGHGRSDAPADPRRYALDDVLDDLGYVLGELGAPRAHWVGYSMGARVALGAAILTPERVERIVLEGGSPGLETEEERSARRAHDGELAERLERDGIEAFVDSWRELPLFESQRRLPEVVREAERRRRMKNDARALAACLRGLGTGAQPSFWGRLADVRAPALLLTGELDPKFTALASRMASSLPNARSLTVPGAGHAVHLEARDPWLEAVTTWLG